MCENTKTEKRKIVKQFDDLMEFPPRYGPVTAEIPERASPENKEWSLLMIRGTKVKVDKLY